MKGETEKAGGLHFRTFYFRNAEAKRLARRNANFFCFFLLTLGFCFAAPRVSAQQDELPPNAAPPPVKYLTKDEKSVLDGEKDFKKRTKLALELMDVRLKKAEGLFVQNSFTPMFDELGIFHALMDLTFINLQQNNKGSGKNLESFKRFEIGLRGFAPRVEAIRRELPERYEYYLKRLLKNMRETRAKTVEPFFGETVLPDEAN